MKFSTIAYKVRNSKITKIYEEIYNHNVLISKIDITNDVARQQELREAGQAHLAVLREKMLYLKQQSVA
jgi:hypothetical protein